MRSRPSGGRITAGVWLGAPSDDQNVLARVRWHAAAAQALARDTYHTAASDEARARARNLPESLSVRAPGVRGFPGCVEGFEALVERACEALEAKTQTPQTRRQRWGRRRTEHRATTQRRRIRASVTCWRRCSRRTQPATASKHCEGRAAHEFYKILL